MIVTPKNEEQRQKIAGFMAGKADVALSDSTIFIGWVEEHELKMCVAFNDFLGKTCQIHVGMANGYNFTPKEMLKVVFDFAFNIMKVEMLLGTVNSHNERAMRYDLHLGFKEEHRIPRMHKDGGDIVLLSMARADCKYLKQDEAA